MDPASVPARPAVTASPLGTAKSCGCRFVRIDGDRLNPANSSSSELSVLSSLDSIRAACPSNVDDAVASASVTSRTYSVLLKTCVGTSSRQDDGARYIRVLLVSTIRSTKIFKVMQDCDRVSPYSISPIYAVCPSLHSSRTLSNCWNSSADSRCTLCIESGLITPDVS